MAPGLNASPDLLAAIWGLLLREGEGRRGGLKGRREEGKGREERGKWRRERPPTRLSGYPTAYSTVMQCTDAHATVILCVHSNCFVVDLFVGEKLPSEVLLSWKPVPDRHWYGWAAAGAGDCQCFWAESSRKGALGMCGLNVCVVLLLFVCCGQACTKYDVMHHNSLAINRILTELSLCYSIV